MTAPAIDGTAERAAAISVELEDLKARRADLIQELTALGSEEELAAPPTARSAGSVLIIDADQEALLAAAQPLRAAGYEVTTAANGAQVLTRLGDAPPDLIIADAALPDITGFEFVAAIRRSPTWENVPLIFLTGATAAPDLELGLGLGTDGYVVCPPDPSELISRVSHALYIHAHGGLGPSHRFRSLAHLVRHPRRAGEGGHARARLASDAASGGLGPPVAAPAAPRRGPWARRSLPEARPAPHPRTVRVALRLAALIGSRISFETPETMRSAAPSGNPMTARS